MPLDKKRSRGRIPLRKKALKRDPIPEPIILREIDEDEDPELTKPKAKVTILFYLNSFFYKYLKLYLNILKMNSSIK